jgi:sphingomyelin phosphodiesterase acid-like 3
MARYLRRVGAPLFAAAFALFGLLTALAADARAQRPAGSSGSASATVKALMVSDIHFEPFWDPAKAAQLAGAPASAWKAILASPDASDREKRFTDLEQSCHARGVDTSYPLLASALGAMRTDAAGVKFITVSGDLIAHSFSCKYMTLFPQATPADYRAFVEKTVAFVAGSLRASFPGVTVYAALGNNDSDCGDYQLDAHGDFLAGAGKIVAADFPAAERGQAETDFAAGGYFSAALPVPHARMLVLDDLFMARKYATCGGKPDTQAAEDQIAWLKQQLEKARREKEKVWVMGHIPPGVDPYSTATKGGNVCAGKGPQMYLSSEAMAETMAGYGDVIQLAIFAHTHMDELRLLAPAAGDAAHCPVAVKMVPSISPIDGNNPSFTVAEVNAASAMLSDYRVYAASNQSGVDATWTEEYDFAKDFGEPAFSASALSDLVQKFAADRTAQSPASQSYLNHYFVGGGARELAPFWPMYVCALNHDEPDAYRACACASGP